MPLIMDTANPIDLLALPEGLVAALDSRVWAAHGAERHLAWGGEALEARCSLWWTETPLWPGARLGLVGHFDAASAAAAAGLLEAACRILSEQGCTLAVGPMDGCTWRSYRFATEWGDHPPFLFDLATPPEYPAWWEAAGFHSFQTYHSNLAEDLDLQDPRLDRVRKRMEGAGIHIRPMNAANFEADLIRIFEISEASFRGNVLYAPLDQEAFLELYRPAAGLVEAGFSLLAEGPEGPEGFIFTVPDALQGQRGEPIDTVVVKTLAVRPGRATAGLGKLLLEESQRAAHERGFRRAVHALMHDQNVSTVLGGGRCIRRYALFARDLA